MRLVCRAACRRGQPGVAFSGNGVSVPAGGDAIQSFCVGVRENRGNTRTDNAEREGLCDDVRDKSRKLAGLRTPCVLDDTQADLKRAL
jgi:hypothetical protein